MTFDDVLITIPQIAQSFGVSIARVRSWVSKGLVYPVRRDGRGRGGTMYFYRGDIANLIYAHCPSCGEAFKRTTLKQGYCSRLCRDRARRSGKV